MRPIFSTTKTRPLPSPACVTKSGWMNCPPTRSARSDTAAGSKPPSTDGAPVAGVGRAAAGAVGAAGLDTATAVGAAETGFAAAPAGPVVRAALAPAAAVAGLTPVGVTCAGPGGRPAVTVSRATNAVPAALAPELVEPVGVAKPEPAAAAEPGGGDNAGLGTLAGSPD
jgi:hypothetical protein